MGKKWENLFAEKNGDLTFELLSGIEIVYTNAIMIKRDIIFAFQGWDEHFRRNQEAVFLIRFFSYGGKIGSIPEALVVFDTSDSQNRSNPYQYQKDFEQFLQYHNKEIVNCKQRYTNAEEIIYSFRYRGILINYIKYGKFFSAYKIWKKMMGLYPRRFFMDCCIYVKRKLNGENIFKEYEKEIATK